MVKSATMSVAEARTALIRLQESGATADSHQLASLERVHMTGASDRRP